MASSAQNGVPSLLAELRLDLEQIIASGTATYIGALLTNNADRWAAMHAPPPVRPPHTEPKFTSTDFKNTVRERPANWRNGPPGTHLPRMLDRPLLPKDSKRAPELASSTSSTANNTFRGAFSTILRGPVNSAASTQHPHIGSRPRTSLSVTTGSSNNTGINPWWTFEEGAIPGVGKYMVNVANGNLIVQSGDVDIPERGIDLAFQRTYNSMSGRDWNADDGSPTPGQYGDGWTNTFDTHLATNSSGGISVFDIDGARYDYAPSDTGCLTAPAGMHNTLCWDGGCGYFWTKTSGTVYYYFEPSFGSGCEYYTNQAPAYAGRLYMIFARNNNNWIRLTYSWAGGDATSSANLTQISVAHEDGQALTLNFAVASSGATLLSSLVRSSDGASITYAYDASNDLTSVTEPSNGSSNGSVNNTMHAYGWFAGHQMSGAAGPRWTTGSWGGDGGYIAFSYSGAQVSNVWHVGIMNFTPADGTGTQLQTGAPTGGWTFGDDQFGYSSGVTTLRDWDGHGTNWYYDSIGRTTQTQEWTGAFWLLTYASWDANNNLTESVDARGNATDYAYDSNGNTVAVALPAVSTNQGTFRPTSLYSYDRTNNANNIVAYCDPVRTHALGQDWTDYPGSSDALCPNSVGATRYAWYDGDSGEPFGRLTDSYTPLGYHRVLGYDTARQGGAQFGLPTSLTGDAVVQTDNTTRTPQQSFTYDSYGNLISYSAGVGSTSLINDNLNRVTAVTDPDSVTSRTCYYPNGQVQAKQSAAQYVLDGNIACGSHSVSYTYDPDGDLASETHHFGTSAGTTSKYYDGADRLVEVTQPHDASADLYSYGWLTRYLYDLSQGNSVSVDGATFHAYGNLFKTQEYLPSTPVIAVNTTPTSPAWTDVRGTSFDALDRATVAYENAFGTTPKTTNTYDSNSNYGLLSQSQNAAGQQTVLSYLSTGWTYQKSFQNDGGVTPSETYSYDPNGRAVSIQSSQFGSENLAYDSDGRLTSDAEPTGGGYTSPATIAYGYYDDGLRKSLSVSSSQLTVSNAFQYSYRVDGLLQTQHLTYPITGDFAWTYTNAGRELTQSDPYTGSVITLYNSQDGPIGMTRTLQAKTFTYDAYGRVASLVLPEGYTYGSFTYDTEDETTGYARSNAYCGTTLNNASCTGGTRTQTYSIRGELVTVGDANQYARSSQLSADGILVNGNSSESYDGFDARSGMAFYRQQTALTYAYDAAGRQTQITNTYPYGYASYATRSYDAENHLISQAYTGTSFSCTNQIQMCGDGNNVVSGGATLTYGWGPNGHPIEVSGPGVQGTASIHWDGDNILMAGDFEVGKLGTADYAGEQYAQSFTVTDRDMSGQAVSGHTWKDFGAWDAAPPTRQCAACSKGQASEGYALPSTKPSDNDMYAPPTSYLSGVRGDGYTDGYGNTFQGVRAYDGNLGTWTTPDEFAGVVHDPTSQKPFMWNRNNPIGYSDPSGYVSQVSTATGSNGQINVTITLYVQFNGDGASKDTKDAIINAIQSAWSGTFGQYNVKTNVVDVTGVTGFNPSLLNTISVTPNTSGTDPFHTDMYNNHMMVGAGDKSGFGYAYEAGHLMGLDDMWDNRRLLPTDANGHRAPNPNFGKPDPGRGDDIMTHWGGKVMPLDIQAIVTSPSNVHI